MENIEAMLCAYIEGDLDESGRKEIEKHLAEHPQHRKLLEDLIAQRQLLRDLPRVTAPRDVGEGLRGQVERSMLLGSQDSMQLSHPQRGFRLPQYITAAAILLLGASLAIIVYRTVVPTFRPPTYTPVAAPNVDQNTQKEIEADIEASKAQNLAAPAQPTTQPVSDQVAMAAVPQAQFRQLLSASNSQLPPPRLDWNDIRQQLKSAGYDLSHPIPGKPPPMIFVVGSPNTATAGRQISQFLGTQTGISWWAVPQTPTTQPTTQMDLAGANRATTQPVAQQASIGGIGGGGSFADNTALRLYIACNLNTQQAAALQQSLNNQPPESVPTYQLSDQNVVDISGQRPPTSLNGVPEPTTQTTEPATQPTTNPSPAQMVDAVIVVHSASSVILPEMLGPTTWPSTPRIPPGKPVAAPTTKP
jgi:hypothetical protein